MFRFCRRARFSPAAALKLLHATCQWRLTSGLLQLTPASISSLYLTKPLFFFHPDLYDRFGRPCAILNLKHVLRTEDGNLDALKDYVRFGWEVARRYLSDLSRSAASTQDATLQMVVIVDLDQAGMSNLVLLYHAQTSSVAKRRLTIGAAQEFELLPFFLDLLKNNFPGMVGASQSGSRDRSEYWSKLISTMPLVSFRAQLRMGLCRNVAARQARLAQHGTRAHPLPQSGRAVRIL